MAEETLPAYLIAICVLVPIAVLTLLLLLLYIFCSRKYKLNWFERNLLEQEEEKEYIHSTSYNTNGSTGVRKNSTVKFKDEPSPVTPYNYQTRRKSSIFQYNPLTENRSESSQEDEFWVPPTVIERKRAQSIVHLGNSPLLESEEDGGIFSPDYNIHQVASPSHQIPTMQDIGSIVAVPQQHRRGRRASMHEAIDFKKLDTSMYKKLQLKRQLSMSRSEDESMGSVNFMLDYNQDTGLFTVRLIQVQDLPVPDRNETMDPYCKLRLYSDARCQHQHLHQTKVAKDDLNPEFEEEFLFEVLPEMMSTTVLEITVYNHDQFSEDEVVGIMRLNVATVDFSQNLSLWKNLVSPDAPQDVDLGRLMFSMAYLCSAERFTIVILKARNLKGVEPPSDDVHVKVSVLLHGRKIKKKKTSTKHGSSPVWNEALVFGLSKDTLRDITIEVAVVHENRLEMNELIGRIMLGAHGDDPDSDHWNDVICGKNTLARWHNLTL